ncbi:hypothetical protein BJF79_30550 [Actinomadura sp. CNU-125]|uniref:hypothetical protein n=1 Tax=Actinomadura sp. CNU-125 TaxID=1904961 RepID=UPI000964C2C1|nr:hypothetical protein [Actinomadura sp. CNU-125]OLT36895.1 hypothetical protein BJF79_30550 [Actinomadura sp. CNU-125]
MSDWEPWNFREPWRLAHYVQKVDLDGDEMLSGGRQARPSDPGGLTRHLYERMLELELGYDTCLTNAKGTGQYVRQPYRVVASKRAGTCLDLSLLFAGLCLAAGLRPAVTVVNYGRGLGRHALVLLPDVQVGAQRLRGPGLDVFDGHGLWTPDAATLREAITGGPWTAVETVSLTGHDGGPYTFEVACENGLGAIGGAQKIEAVDVGALESEYPPYRVSVPLANRHPLSRPPDEPLAYAEKADAEIRRRYPRARLPPVLDVPHLEAARDTATDADADLIRALITALKAKRVFDAVGGGSPRLEELHLHFFEAASAHVGAESGDVFLAEAALKPPNPGLGILARFVLSVAHGNGVGTENPTLVEWLRRQGEQRENVDDYLRTRQERHWAIIHIGGPEPVGPDTRGGDGASESVKISMEVRPAITAGRITPQICAPEDIPATLGRLVDDLYLTLDGREVLVDLVAPRRFLDRKYERLSKAVRRKRHRPRLRWYGHVWDETQMRQQRERYDLANWQQDPIPVPDDVALGRRALDDWLWETKVVQRPVVIAGSGEGSRDLLQGLLSEGCGHIVWFAAGDQQAAEPATLQAWKEFDSSNRKTFFPDELMGASVDSASIIWNDPDGRSRFRLPEHRTPKAPRRLRGTSKRKMG